MRSSAGGQTATASASPGALPPTRRAVSPISCPGHDTTASGAGDLLRRHRAAHRVPRSRAWVNSVRVATAHDSVLGIGWTGMRFQPLDVDRGYHCGNFSLPGFPGSPWWSHDRWSRNLSRASAAAGPSASSPILRVLPRSAPMGDTLSVDPDELWSRIDAARAVHPRQKAPPRR